MNVDVCSRLIGRSSGPWIPLNLPSRGCLTENMGCNRLTISLVGIIFLLFASENNVGATASRGEASPSKPASKKSVSEYEIPQYPLPPRPASAPPPTMPFAVADTPRMNAFAPPSQHVNDFKVPGSYNGDKEKTKNPASTQLKPNARTGDIAYDEPPTTRNIVPPTAAPPGPGSDGTFEMRKDSVNPYCNFCMAYMLSFSHGLPNPCKAFPARSQEACKQVVAALSQQSEPARLVNGCIDRTSVLAKVKGPKACPPIVACNLIKAGNGMPMCGVVANSWGAWKDTNSDHLSTINPDPLPNALPPGRVSGASNPYCEICTFFMNLGGASMNKVENICMLMADSQQTDCLAVGAELKRNEDVHKIAKEGCIDTTGGVEKKVSPCPGTIACNLIRDTTKGPMCGGMLGEFGKTIDTAASPNPGEKSNLKGGS